LGSGDGDIGELADGEGGFEEDAAVDIGSVVFAAGDLGLFDEDAAVELLIVMAVARWFAGVG
jgi:hypothetical protein